MERFPEMYYVLSKCTLTKRELCFTAVSLTYLNHALSQQKFAPFKET